MKKLFFLLTVLLPAVMAAKVLAYSQYSQNRDATYCAACHGGFRASPYTSLVDGQNWGDDLHNIHRNVMLGGDCNACHAGTSRFPVLLGSSSGGAGLSQLSCVGCHGRAEDNASPLATYGAGLRQHHYRVDPTKCPDCTICANCHADSNPANYTPVGEDILPPYYSNNDSNHPNIPADPCNPAGAENYAGSSIALDNDGDGIFDLADTDCQLLSPTPSPLDFGSISTGNSSTSSVTIGNGFNVDITISDIGLSGTDAGVFNLDVGDGSGGTCGTSPVILSGSSCIVSVTFSPTTKGTKTASLNIVSDGGNPSVVLNGNGIGTAGAGQNANSSVYLLLLGN